MLQYRLGQFSTTTGRFLFGGNGTRVLALMSPPYMADEEAGKYNKRKYKHPSRFSNAPATTVMTGALVLPEPTWPDITYLTSQTSTKISCFVL
jgi:hypothetical protein